MGASSRCRNVADAADVSPLANAAFADRHRRRGCRAPGGFGSCKLVPPHAGAARQQHQPRRLRHSFGSMSQIRRCRGCLTPRERGFRGCSGHSSELLSDGALLKSPSSNVGKWLPCEKTSTRNTRPRSASKQSHQRMTHTSDYPAALGLDRWYRSPNGSGR